MERDLGTLDGLRAYVEGELVEALQASAQASGAVPPIGVVVTLTGPDGAPMEKPQPALFGGFGEVEGAIRALTRDRARALSSPCVIFAAQEGRDVVVTMEHRAHGFRTWRARLSGNRLGTLREIPAVETRFLPQRWAN